MVSARPPGDLVCRCYWLAHMTGAAQYLVEQGKSREAEGLRDALDALVGCFAREFGDDQVSAAMDLAGKAVFGDDFSVDSPGELAPGGRAADPVRH